MKSTLSWVLLAGLTFSMSCSAAFQGGGDDVLSEVIAGEVSSGTGDGLSAMRCLTSLKANETGRKISELSVFREFNQYPPRPFSVLRPRDVKLPLSQIKLDSQCLTYMPFDFDIFESAELREGRINDLHPIYLWGEESGFVVIYMHRSYERKDGEGEAVIFSAVIYDSSGQAGGYIKEVSSWYEYEGSIRIRDAKLVGGEVTIGEIIFDPIELDVEGRILKYGNTGGLNKIRGYSWTHGGYREQ